MSAATAGAGLIACIREQAASHVRRVNPGRVHCGPAFDEAAATTAREIVRRLVAMNLRDGNLHIARAIRRAWDHETAASERTSQ